VVTAVACFDDLRIPPEHPGRQPSDTYYVTDATLLRTHTSAHQSQHLRAGCEAFLCTGDVYRRDEIDR
jgi:phenylalanyl-tRNA synthetase alpha chain